MTGGLSCHNVLVTLLVAALVSASVIVNSECRPMGSEEDWNLQMKSVLEELSRDEIVQMAGYGEEKLSTALITGSLLCFKNGLSASERSYEENPQPISGALVGAICTSRKEKRATWTKAVTDEHGEFIIDLPSHLHAIPKLDKACSVRTLQLPKDSSCYRSAYARKSTQLTLSSHGNGVRTYTTGIIALASKVSQNSEA